ncbi:TonB-dependent receptor [Sphingomonas sp.]|uniref:TonB-dependent receptor n=1 Tax=Sphingomonas sp. TaxID=28214 RepID=UPI001D55A6D7|nr:TonB-dependent receptor [Sphingomonas sp.]MBX9796700.1 TonB-dependent receptor [Sphingomonas sp.]
MAPGMAAAQEAAPEVVVRGTPLTAPPGAPAYGTVTITAERLSGDAAGRVETALADVAGFQQFRRSDSRSANPSAQGVTLRALGGNAASRALVLLDGVPIADPFFGFVPFNALVPGQLGAARVTRGGGSGAFGAGALTGTVALESAAPDALPRWSALAEGGSFNAQRLAAGAAPRLGAGVLALSGQWQRADGFFTTPPDQRAPASAPAAYQDWTVGARLVAPVDAATEVQARLSLFGDRRTLRFAGADSFSQGGDASVRLVHRGRWQVEALAYLQLRDFGNRVISATTFRPTLDQRATPSLGAGAKLELRPPVGGGHVLRFGIDARHAEGRALEDAYAASGAVTARRALGGQTGVVGAYVEDDWVLGALTLTAGARVDRWMITGGFFSEGAPTGAVTARRFADRAGTELSGRAGLLWRPVPALALRAAGYTGFRVPTLNELYRPFVVFPVATQANAALDLERLRGGEAGVELTPMRGLRLSVTGFVNRLEGAIANVTIGTNLRQRQNLRAIDARGVEVEAAYQRGAWSLTASYAHNDSRVASPGALDGRRPAQSPADMLSTTLAWARGGWAASATLRHTGRQFEDDLSLDALPPVTTVDAVLRVPLLRRVAFSLRAENLADARIVTRNAAGSIDLGVPRTLWIGLFIAG